MCKSVNVSVTAKRVNGIYMELSLEVVLSCPVWVLGT